MKSHRGQLGLGFALAAAASAAVAVGSGRVLRRFLRQRSLLSQLSNQLLPTRDQLEQIRSELLGELEFGLANEVEANGKHLLMLPTYVARLPNGEETGDVYAIDVGGTNFRVMYVHLADVKSKIDRQDIYQMAIPKDVYTGTGTQLFDFFAKAISDFMERHEGCSNTKKGLLPIIGFCWSFPLKQTALNRGILLDWTKGFTCDGVIGNDPVQLLSEALERAGRPCQILALLNDTVGVLAAQRYLDPDTDIGVIIGTGTNACYVQKVTRVTKWTQDVPVAADASTCINIEWGAFDSPSLPRCQEDWEVDAATIHVGKYLFEKLLSGMYIGEVARRILLRMAQDPGAALFGSGPSGAVVPEALTQTGGFTSAHLASIVDDKSLRGVKRAAAMHKALGHPVPLLGQQAVYQVCCIVARRSAQLVACALHAILEHAGWLQQPRRFVVAFDGGVYEQFSTYREMLRQELEGMMGKPSASLVEFVLTKGGSCMGAAMLAAAANKGLQH